MGDLAALLKAIEQLKIAALEPGEVWFVVDSHWYRKMTDYLQGNGDFPGPIDNSGMYEGGSTSQMKENLQDEDYVLVPTPAWNLLKAKFGMGTGQEPIPRKVIATGVFVKHHLVEVYPLKITLQVYSDPENVVSVPFSRMSTPNDLKKEARTRFQLESAAQIRLYQKVEDDYYAITEDKAQSSLHDLCLTGHQIIVIDVEENGKWHFEPREDDGRNSSDLRPKAGLYRLTNGFSSGNKTTHNHHHQMASASQNSVEQMCECPVCLETYEDPRSLPCGHSMCKKCVNRCIGVSNRTIACPVCRVRSNISSAELPINYALRDLVAQIEKDKSNKYICCECSLSFAMDQLCCCDTCSVTLICLKCIFKNHKGHKGQLMSDILRDGQTKLDAWRLQIMKTVDGTNQVTSFGTASKRLDMEWTRLINTIENATVLNLVTTGQFEKFMRVTPKKIAALQAKKEYLIAEFQKLVDEIKKCHEDIGRIDSQEDMEDTEDGN